MPRFFGHHRLVLRGERAASAFPLSYGLFWKMDALDPVCVFHRSGECCTQGNHEGSQSGGGSGGFCGPALLLFHLQPPLQTKRYLDPGSLFQPRNPNTGDCVRPWTSDGGPLPHWQGIPWSADIVLNDTRVSDAGIYRCMVNNPPEAADPGIGELVLSVLAPPSLPVCQWDGDIDMGGSVTLSCSVAEGVPTPDIQWDKLSPAEISLPINMEGDLSGSVQIVNVSSQTSGLYRCSATNLLGTENCYVNLSIYSTPDSSSGILQGVLLTLSMSLVLLALLVLVLWLHRTGQDGRWGVGKEEEEECYNEIRYTPSLMKRSFV
ncbi:immunoglobulin superfamily member 11 isoform X1 [Trachinotus anak]|uniref:immunoglobulin superfamily member 11 isoform X1 n=1 Tax=Trachinotus anak TaxID=443729 RepID=UPI0039F1C493